MLNEDFRRRMRAANVKQWRVAEKMGVSERTLIVWLRSELSGERLQRVEAALEALEKEGGTNG